MWSVGLVGQTRHQLADTFLTQPQWKCHGLGTPKPHCHKPNRAGPWLPPHTPNKEKNKTNPRTRVQNVKDFCSRLLLFEKSQQLLSTI